MSKCKKAFEVVEDKKYDPPRFSVVGPNRFIVITYEEKHMARWLAIVLNYAYRCGSVASAKKAEYSLELTSEEAAVLCEAVSQLKAPHDLSKRYFADTYIGSMKSLDKKIMKIRKDFIIPTKTPAKGRTE